MADSYQLKAILSAVDNLSPTLKAVAGAAKNTRKYIGDIGTSLGNLTAKVGIPTALLGGLAASFGALAIKKAVIDFTDLAEALQKSALKTGMTVEQLQRMKYVADQAGVSTEAMEGSLGKLNKNIANAVSGKNKDLADMFVQLGIPLKDANGGIRDAADLLPQLADAFKSNKSPVLQAAMGTTAFGKAYQEMLPLLAEGSAGIEKSLARFGVLKGAIPADEVAMAKDFGDKLKDLNIVTKGFQMTIAKELIPTLSPLIESFIQWSAVNRKLIAGQVKKVVQDLVAALKSFDWEGFIGSVKSAFAAIGTVIDGVGGLKNALIILAVVMNAQTILAVGGLVGSLGRLALAMFALVAPALAATLQMGLLAAAMGVSAGAALTTSLKMAAGSAGLLAAAAAVGYAIGTVLYNTLIADTRFGDWLGEKLAQVLAFFGNADAKAALASTAKLASSQTATVAADIARPAQATGPQAAPGALGSGSFNLAQPATTNVGGAVTVKFENAPPGMRVEPAASTNPRVPLRTDVGYRSFATGTAF